MSKKSTITEQILLREINGDFGVLKYIACQKLYNLYMKEWYFESNYLPLLYTLNLYTQCVKVPK